MKEIYVLLTCTGTVFSRAIKHFTGSEYTHSSIALDINCDHLYSFARRQEFPPLPAGFVREDISTGILAKYSHCKCAFYRLTVDDDTYFEIEKELYTMSLSKNLYPYNCFGPLLCFLKIPYHSSGKYFCSEFVADILNKHGALKLDTPPSLVQPNDFASNEDLTLVYEGTLKDFSLGLTQLK
jgi:inositol transport system substrate-binding protein